MSRFDQLTNLPARIDPEAAIGVARIGTGLLRRGAAPVDMVLAGVEGDLSATREMNEISRRFGGLNLQQQSRGFKRKIAALRERWKNRMGEAAVAAGGGFLGATGATMATAAMLGPVGWVGGAAIGLGGSIAGGYAADKAYNAVNPREEQDPVMLIARISEAQQHGEKVPEEAVFAALAMNLPIQQERKIMDRLEQMTGTRLFDEALAMGRTAEIRQLMREFDLDVRSDSHMPINAEDPTRTVAEQYAELINTGRIQADKLLEQNVDLAAAIASPPRQTARTEEEPMPPVTPAPTNQYRGRAA